MKKRRTLIISLLLIAALALGIGYAAISGDLVATGKVVTKAQPFNVHFIEFGTTTSSAVLSNSPTIACDTLLSESSPAKAIMLNIADMASAGDEVSAVLKVRNDNDDTMNVSVASIKYGDAINAINSDAYEYFDVKAEWVTDATGETLAADPTKATVGTEDSNNCAYVKITVTMTQSTDDAYTGYFQVTLHGESAPNP